jgi:hypothetical protein
MAHFFDDPEVFGHRTEVANIAKVYNKAKSKQYTSTASLCSSPASHDRVGYVARAVNRTASPLKSDI